MPTFEQRSGGWRVKVRVKGLEKPLTATFKTKAEAARWALEQEAGARAARRGELPDKTVAQAFRRYAEEVSSKKPGERWETVRLTRMEGVHKTQVFTVTAASRDALFRKARDRCEIEGLTFHDSRATAATRLAKKFDVLTLARILGHRDPRSVMVYYRETAESMAARMDD